MAGARPSGTVSLGDAMFNDDEEENSADSVEQAALEGARRDESLLDPDSLMFEELDDDRQLITEDEDEEEEITMVRKGREYDDQGAASAGPSYDDPDSILNTPYGSPLSDVSSISNNQKWIGEVKKMLLEDQRKTENRTKTWVTNPGEPIPSLGSAQLGPPEGQSHWDEQFEDSLPEMGFDLPSAEELAEKYSNDLIEKDLLILEKDKHISTLEKAQRELKSTLEDCQKELHIQSEAATSGVEQIKRSLEEKDKCIMETSEKLRKVTESYNSSEKRWKEQQEFLEKQIKKLKSELEEKGTHDEELKKMTEAAVLEKQELEQKLVQAREERDVLKQQFVDVKKTLKEELEKLRDEKTELLKTHDGLVKLKDRLHEEIQILNDKLTLSEQAVEKANNDMEVLKLEKGALGIRLRNMQEELNEYNAEVERQHYLIQNNEIAKGELESKLDDLKEKIEHYKLVLREVRYEKEQMQKQFDGAREQMQKQIDDAKEQSQKQVDDAKQRVEVTADDDAPVNFFRQDNEAASTEPWTDTKKSLEDRIAELELEKGNLLLQLVDVDEHEQQDAKRNAELTAVAEENAMQLEVSKKALEELEKKHEILEKELEETKSRETQRIENAMTTIAWEEKYEELQKQNQSLQEELQSQRQAADELSGRYEELEKKCTDLELGKAPIEGLADIDKCDGWSDGAPQLPDEGFTEMEAQITELKAALEGKQANINEMFSLVNEMKDKLSERTLIICTLEAKIEEITSEKRASSQKLQECMAELERTQKELLEKATEQQVVQVTNTVTVVESADGWNDDPPVLLDEGFNDDNQIVELKQELAKKVEELSTTTEKCRGMEDKLKKALRALKQKNEKLAELKNRLGDDTMSTSTISSMEASVVLEPVVEKSITSDLGSSISSTLQLEVDRLKRECEEKDAKIQEYEDKDEDIKLRRQYYDSKTVEYQEMTSSLNNRDLEIASLRKQLTQLATTLGSKNEEVEQLMKACEEMQRSIDDKVELLNDCVSKKDVEVRQAISQYEDMLKDTTLNVSHLTKELEELIRERNSLQAQLLDAQQQTLEAQNEFDRYREDKESGSDSLEDKEQELDQLKKECADLRERLDEALEQVGGNYLHTMQMTEALDQAEAEKKQLREEFLCVQNEFGSKSKEMQVHISELIDHLNEREAAISVMEARLKESDEQAEKISNEIKHQLEEKSKALEQAEQALFVKTEESVRLEERLRETDEYYRREVNTKIAELQEQHRVALEAYATQTSEDLERTCEQLAKKNREVVELQDQLTVMQGEYSSKCAELSQTELMATEINSLKATIETLKASLESYTQAFNNASAELNAKNNEISDMRTICGQYEEKYYNITVTQESTQRALQESQATLAQCQQEMATLYSDLQNSQTEKDMLRNSQVEYQQTIEKLNGEISEAKTEAARQASETQNRANQLAKYHDIEANLNRYLEDLNSATEELGKRNSEYRELQKSCRAQEVQIQSLQASVEATRKELADLQEKVSEKNQLIVGFEAQVVELQAGAQTQQQGLSPELSKELLEELEEKKREISDLRFELDEGIIQEKRLKEHLESRENEIRQLKNVISEKESEIAETWQSWRDNQSQPAVPEEVGSGDGGPVMERLEQAEKEREGLERKIDLLQNKLEEVEDSEVKCYEDFSRLKVLRTELEMDNLRMSSELEQLRRSLQDGDNDPKYKSMENQLILMTKTLEDRDKLCRDLLKNISQLQESCDVLRIRVNSMTLPQPFALSPDSLEAKFVEQDREIFSLRVDLEREKKIRELYEGQLFLATSKKQFENSTRKSTSSGSWFGLGELFSSPSPPRPSPAPSSRSSVSTSLAPPASMHSLDQSSASAYGGRPITPLTPATAFSASLFDNSGLAGQGQQQYFAPQASPRPSSAQGPQYFIPQMQTSPGLSPGQGTQPAQSSTPGVVESPYANFSNQP